MVACHCWSTAGAVCRATPVLGPHGGRSHTCRRTPPWECSVCNAIFTICQCQAGTYPARVVQQILWYVRKYHVESVSQAAHISVPIVVNMRLRHVVVRWSRHGVAKWSERGLQQMRPNMWLRNMVKNKLHRNHVLTSFPPPSL